MAAAVTVATEVDAEEAEEATAADVAEAEVDTVEGSEVAVAAEVKINQIQTKV